MIEGEKRTRLVQEARSWVGTPWARSAETRGQGVDAPMLIVRCLVDTGLAPAFDPRPYPESGILLPDSPLFMEFIAGLGLREFTGNPMPGDVMIWALTEQFAHAGIVAEWPHVVRVFDKERAVKEDVIPNLKPRRLGTGPNNSPAMWQRPGLRINHPMRFFSVWGASGPQQRDWSYRPNV